MDSAVVLLSGGMGSAVAAFRGGEGVQSHPLYIDYGRTSATEERKAASALADALGVPLRTVDLPHVRQIAELFRTRSADNTHRPGGLSESPGLAMTLLAVGVEYAASVGARTLVSGQFGHTTSDAAPNLSRERTVDPREFRHAFASMLEAALPTVRSVRLEVPLLDLEGGEVVKLGNRLHVPFEWTWSCHRSAPPCGTCPGCTTRRRAFEQAGMADPLGRTPARPVYAG